MNGACVMRSTKRMPHWVRRNESYVNSDTVIMYFTVKFLCHFVLSLPASARLTTLFVI